MDSWLTGWMNTTDNIEPCDTDMDQKVAFFFIRLKICFSSAIDYMYLVYKIQLSKLVKIVL